MKDIQGGNLKLAATLNKEIEDARKIRDVEFNRPIIVNHLLHLSDELNISDLPGVLNLLVLTLDDHLGVPGFLELSLEASNGSNRDPCVSGNGFCIRL